MDRKSIFIIMLLLVCISAEIENDIKEIENKKFVTSMILSILIIFLLITILICIVCRDEFFRRIFKCHENHLNDYQEVSSDLQIEVHRETDV